MAANRPASAQWRVVEDPDATHLHVELWNGHSVSITVWKDGAAQPFVALRTAEHGEHDLAECDHAAFRRWLDQAQGRR
jgi:hypothetical protein